MKVWAFGSPAAVLRNAGAAVVLSLAAAIALPAPVHAENNDPVVSQQQKKKKRFLFSSEPRQATPARQAHSAGSGTKATTQSGIVNDDSIAPFIAPDSAAAMQAMADKYAGIAANGGWPRLPKGNLKKGAKGKHSGILNRRLHIEGYLRAEATQGEFAEVFTSATEEALMRFQRNHGLAVTGKVDGPTLLALNVPAERRLATIRANLPRLAEYSKDLGERYIVVNIPAQQIETVSGGKVYSLHNAIVGRASRPTPVVMTPLTIIRFNPYWNAPASIVEKDILPRMISKGPSKIMREMNMKVFDGVGGPEIDPDDVNWRRVRVDDYHFRQEPGGSNAMATAKIEFSSPFGIYLHDTPEPHLFDTGSRFYSSGCVRVDKVAVLIDWILQGQDGIDTARIAQLAETKERLDTPVANAPQLRVAYLTAWPAKDGVAAFRPDVYELDGSGFVLGQPLPVGEKLDGQRYVLKPIPRLQQDIDTDDGLGFASLFRLNSSKTEVAGPGMNRKKNDSLINLSSTSKARKDAELKKKRAQERAERQKELAEKKKAAEKAKAAAARKKADEKAKRTKELAEKKKAAEKAKLAAKKKAAGKPVKTAKADTKADAKAKKVVKKDEAQAAAKKPADAKAPAKTPAAKPAPADCKPGAGGKLPAGCKAEAPAKKDKKEKTASVAD